MNQFHESIRINTRLLKTIKRLKMFSDHCAYLHQFAWAIQADLFHQLSWTHHLWGEVVNMRNGFGANSLKAEKDKTYLNSFNI